MGSTAEVLDAAAGFDSFFVFKIYIAFVTNRCLNLGFHRTLRVTAKTNALDHQADIAKVQDA